MAGGIIKCRKNEGSVQDYAQIQNFGADFLLALLLQDLKLKGSEPFYPEIKHRY